MSRAVSVGGLLHDGFPRVSGDEPGAVAHVVWDCRFSPRERG
mgnify:CR=1 FL=1